MSGFFCFDILDDLDDFDPPLEDLLKMGPWVADVVVAGGASVVVMGASVVVMGASVVVSGASVVVVVGTGAAGQKAVDAGVRSSCKVIKQTICKSKVSKAVRKSYAKTHSGNPTNTLPTLQREHVTSITITPRETITDNLLFTCIIDNLTPKCNLHSTR